MDLWLRVVKTGQMQCLEPSLWLHVVRCSALDPTVWLLGVRAARGQTWSNAVIR